MVSLDQLMYTELTTNLAAVADVYFDSAPTNEKPPYIVYSLVDAPSDGIQLNSRSGTARFQLDIYAATAFDRSTKTDLVARWCDNLNKTIDGVRVFRDSVVQRYFRKEAGMDYRGTVDLVITWRE